MESLKRGSLLVWVAVLGILSLTGMSLFLRATTPYDGARIEQAPSGWQADGVIVAQLEAQQDGLRAGDRVITINGVSLDSLAGGFFATGSRNGAWHVNQTITYTVVRGNGELDVPVELRQFSLEDFVLRHWGTFAMLLAFLVLGITVFFKRPSEPAALALLLIAVATAGSMPFLLGLHPSDLLNTGLFWFYQVPVLISYTLLFCALLHLALTFPQPGAWLAKRRWLVPSLYAVPFAVHVIVLPLLRFIVPSQLVWFGLWGAGVAVGELIYLPLALIAMVYRFRGARDGLNRQQVRWVVWAVAISISVYLLFLTLPGYVLGYALINDNWAALVGLLIPFAFAIAILRYRLFDIDIIINRTLVYGTLSTGILVVYLFTVGLFGTLLNTNVNLAAAIVTVGLTVLLLQPLRARLQRSVDRTMSGAVDMPTSHRDPEEFQPASEKTSTGRWLVLAYAAWFICAALAVLIFLAAIPLGYALRLSGASFGFPIDAPAWYVEAMSIAQGVASMLVALVSLTLAGILFWKKRNDLMTLLVSFYLLVYGIAMAGPLEALNGFPALFPGAPTPGGMLVPADAILGIQSALFVPVLLFFYLFPNGRFVPRWTRYATLLVLLFSPLFIHTLIYEWMPTTTPLGWSMIVAYLMLLGAGIYAQIYRYRRVASPVERQKTKWVVFGLVLTFFLLGVCQIPYAIVSQLPADSTHPWWVPLMGLVWWVSLGILPISLAIAVMGFRLWDIDLILNRTLVYGTLTASIVAIYILLIAGLGILLQVSGNLFISLLATALIAVLFQPWRQRLQGGVNRLMYGERDDPYAVVSRLGQRLEATLEPGAVLPTIVETVAQALKLPYAAIALKEGDNFQIAAEYRPPGLAMTRWRGQVQPLLPSPTAFRSFPWFISQRSLANCSLLRERLEMA